VSLKKKEEEERTILHGSVLGKAQQRSWWFSGFMPGPFSLSYIKTNWWWWPQPPRCWCGQVVYYFSFMQMSSWC